MSADQPHSDKEIAETWISYNLWSASRPPPSNNSTDELRERDAEAERHGFWAWEAVNALVREHPDHAWTMILRLVELSPDERTLANVAGGPLEDLVGLQPHAFIDRIEEQARKDSRFRRCLS